MRAGMSCKECGLTDEGMHAGSANDDSVDPYSAADLMGAGCWALYCERWNPMRWIPKRRVRAKRRAS